MIYNTRLVLLSLALSCSPAFSQDHDKPAPQGRTLIVFDASGSMWGQIEGKPKISIAKETFASLFAGLGESSEVGLIAYGHRRKGDCNDIETLVPVGRAGDVRRSLSKAVAGLNPKGKTPLSKAVRSAAQALKFTEDKATVVLVTDGIETCNADPCALGRELEQSGIDFTTHVVGFGLSKDEGQQVACLAENTGGLYLSADDAGQLSDALERTVVAEPVEPEAPKQLEKVVVISQLSLVEGGPPLDVTGFPGLEWSIEGPLDENGKGVVKVVPGGREGGLYHKLARGKYRYSVSYRLDGHSEKIIETGNVEEQREVVPINGAKIEAFADFSIAENDTRALESLRWELLNIDKNEKLLGDGQSVDFYVPPGKYELRVQSPRGKFDEFSPVKIDAVAGDTIPGDFILPVSKVSVSVVERDQSSNKSVRYALHSVNEDGSKGKLHRYMPGIDPVYAMPGAYILVVEAWDGTKRKVEQKIEVGFSEALDIEVQLP